MREILKNALYFGIDNLEIYINKKEINFFDDIVFEIDEDNTPSAFIELSDINFHYIKTHPKGYDFGYKFHMIWKTYDKVKNKDKDIIIDAFSLNFSREDVLEKDNGENYRITLVLYSQLCTLYNQQKFDLISFLKENFSFLSHTRWRRPDFCIDFELPKTEILRFFRLRKFPKREFNYETKKFDIVYIFDKKGKKIPVLEFRPYYTALNIQPDGQFQTYYTRNILSDKNRLMLTRLYDKLSDTWKKKKGFLYTHLDHEYVSRVEVEIRKEYAQTISYNIYDVLENPSIQWQIFIDFINKDLRKDYRLTFNDIELVPFIKLKEFSLQRYIQIEKRDFDLSTNFQKLGFIPKRYMDHANGYAKNILDQTGYDGFTQYIFGNYFDDDKKVVRLPNGQKKYTCYRNPDILLISIVKYLKETLHFPQEKINKILKPFISTPILKLKN